MATKVINVGKDDKLKDLLASELNDCGEQVRRKILQITQKAYLKKQKKLHRSFNVTLEINNEIILSLLNSLVGNNTKSKRVRIAGFDLIAQNGKFWFCAIKGLFNTKTNSFYIFSNTLSKLCVFGITCKVKTTKLKDTLEIIYSCNLQKDYHPLKESSSETSTKTSPKKQAAALFESLVNSLNIDWNKVKDNLSFDDSCVSFNLPYNPNHKNLSQIMYLIFLVYPKENRATFGASLGNCADDTNESSLFPLQTLINAFSDDGISFTAKPLSGSGIGKTSLVFQSENITFNTYEALGEQLKSLMLAFHKLMHTDLIADRVAKITSPHKN